MPGKVKVKIVSGRNLPIMDRSNLTTDAYVEVKLGSTIYKTDVYRKSLNPVWNSEWFRFEMDDLELQDEPLQIRLMDHDTYSSNDAIGKVYLDLNPLLCNSSRGKDTSGKMISGWIPVYDTMHGIRGEVNLIVKVELFSDLNKFRQSSCGVRFFFTQSVPEGYIAHIMQGFVEELVVNDDPEYQWIDKIRTPRASNEARQTLFSKLSGEVQRKVGLKALELGGNAVIGYKQCFDLEGESGIVVRGIGTAAYLTKQYESQLSPTCGETLGLSREVTDLQGYRSAFTKHYSRSLRRRGCPGRAPRLQRRSFRVTSSSDSMSVLHHQLSKDDLDDGFKKKCHHDDTCCVLGRAAAYAGGEAAELPSTCGAGGAEAAAVLATRHRHGSCEGFKERRSTSFREDSLMRLVKFHLKKSLLTSSTQSIPPSTSSTSATHYNKDVFLIGSNSNTKVPIEVTSQQKNQLIVATSEPCIEVSSMQYSAGEGLTKCPSFTTTSTVPASPLPHKTSISVSLTTPNSTSCRSRSTSRSPLCSKSSRHNNLMECSSAVIHENDIADSSFSCRQEEKQFIACSVIEPCGRSRSALASCMVTHHRTLSETISPALSSQTVQEHGICRTLSRSVNNLNQDNTETFSPQRQNPPELGGYLGGGGGADFESAGSNLDSNVDEDSTSDTSLRYLYGCVGENVHGRGGAPGGATSCRIRRDVVEIESDTSKDFTKATSSGNDACSVDNDELSPVSEREGFLSLRKKRGSRRKDRYSKSSLMKRASTNFYERGYLLGGTERIKEEVAKFFKRKKSSDDNESCSSSTTKNPSSSATAKKCTKSKSSPYREAKFFFRKRRTTSNSTTKNLPDDGSALNYSIRSKSSSQLFRSNSDSHSLGQTSLDSLPSVGSEPLFDAEDDDSTHHDILTSTANEMFYLNEKFVGPNVTIVPALKIPEVDEEEKENQSVINIEEQSSNCSTTKKNNDSVPSVNPASHNVLQLNRSKIIEIIKELGYSTESPLKLYISSMDALLVYDPSDEPSSTTTPASGGGAATAAAAANAKDTFDATSGGGYATDSSASALSQHSCAFKPAIFHATTADSINNYSKFSGTSCCSSSCCCSRRSSKCSMVVTPPSTCTARSPRYLCRHGTIKSRPLLRNSESESTNPSALNSFSTVGSSSRLGEVPTTDSFNTCASESAKNSFSVLNQVIRSHNGNSWLLGRTDNDKCNNCFMMRTNDDYVISDSNIGDTPGASPGGISCPIHDSSTHNCYPSSRGGGDDDDYYHPIAEENSSKESILLYRANSRNCCNCEDILQVVTVSNSAEEVYEGQREGDNSVNVDCRKTKMKEAELNENINVMGENSDEQIGVAGCNRSPIPEELLFDRTTPTQLPISNQPCGNVNHSLTTIVGGSSNASTAATVLLSSSTAATNNISQNVSATSIPFTVNSSNSVTNNNSNSTNNNTGFVSRHGGCVVAHQHSDPISNSNITTTATTTNNNNPIGGCAGDISKRIIGTKTSPEEKSAINGGNNVARLDEIGKESLASSTPCPSHPNCEPQLYHQQQTTNGLGTVHHHRHPLHHQAACREMPTQLHSNLSQEVSIEVLEATQHDCGDSTHDRNGSITLNKVGLSKTPNIVYHPGISRYPSTGSAYLGPSHANMTTTILTTGTGTLPIVVGGGGSGGALHRRSSESDLSTPPKPNTISTSTHMRGFPTTGLKPGITTTIDQYGLMEYPFITISQFPSGFLTHIGGTVTARSVKLLERISNLEEPESRDAWWNEIRMEIRAHCRAFGCTVVVGYEEHTTMCDDVCVLSASGTAAIAATTIGLKNVELLTVSTKQGTTNPVIADTPCPGRGVEKDRAVLSKIESVINSAAANGALKHLLVTPSKLRHDSDHDQNCSMLHIPSNPAGLPFPVKMSRCHVCRKGRVPDVLIVTVDVPPGLHITGKGTLIQAQVFRPKKDCKGEISAKEVSDSLPFLEYELHRRLINKLKVKGMNAIFGLKVQICLGDKLMVAVATGTAMYVTALPPPGVPIITAGNLKTDAQKVLQYQKVVQDAYDRNRQHYDLKSIPIPTNGRQSGSSGEDSDDEENADVHSSNKDTYILEVDDAEDIDIISMLIDPHPTTAFLMNNIDYLHGYEEHHVSSQQMFTQVWRCRIPTLSLRQFTAYFERLIRAVCFKLRKMMPCILSKLSFTVELPEPDEMQISIIGLALGMTDQSKVAVIDKFANIKSGSALSVAKEDSELMFPLEDESSASGSTTGNSVVSGQQTAGIKTGDQPSGNNETNRDHRSTPPPTSGNLVPVVGQMHNSGVALIPRTFPHQSCTISSSPHSHCSSHLSGNGCGHVNASGTAPYLLTAHAPQLSKCVSGDSTAGNLASSSNSIPPGHGVNYSFRGGTTHSQQPFPLSRSGSKVIPKSALQFIPKPKFSVEITPLSYIPGARIDKYLGNLNFFFIRETTSIRENGGLSGFVHNFVAEVLAIVRAHVAALGGNAMVSYFMTELALLHNPHKNQGQCLINVGGDVVLIVHPSSISDEAQLGS